MSRPSSPPPRLRRGLGLLRVARRFDGAPPHRGKLIAGSLILPCALGRSGVTRAKREGDGATPAGRLRLLYFMLRPGRAACAIPSRSIRPDDLWCDDPESFSYNRPLRAPTKLGHERLWRGDRLYDVVGVLDYNIRPRALRRGSAIFFHIATPDLGPTAGCVALRARDMARLLPRLARGVRLAIDQPFE
ncbi:L,D-transpeptidase [Methylosinus sp. Sm6]|uniref:L,D-transpeptidase family protein n=1 Tax=Methylosinus sp. Sm6 TaxID=2866948 RepID=UPI001C996C12|nr:L,D-transpeptidase family protein [Methylosinus sp. Sm6]MBY6242407.1 L,D-transpeptidase family protein [Methylosinus sp. Sm6]